MSVKSPIFPVITFLFTLSKIGSFHGASFWKWLCCVLCNGCSCVSVWEGRSSGSVRLQRVAFVCVSSISLSDRWVGISCSLPFSVVVWPSNSSQKRKQWKHDLSVSCCKSASASPPSCWITSPLAARWNQFPYCLFKSDVELSHIELLLLKGSLLPECQGSGVAFFFGLVLALASLQVRNSSWWYEAPAEGQLSHKIKVEAVRLSVWVTLFLL